MGRLAETMETATNGGRRTLTGGDARATRENAPPLSAAQRRLWLLNRLEPDNSALNLCLPLRLKGRLDEAALGRAVGEIVRRHEILRTSYEADGGRVVQALAPAAAVDLPRVDLTPFPPEEHEAQVRRLTHAEMSSPFALTSAPLLRARLLRLSDEEHVLLVTTHHIVSDGWSMGLLVREAAELYGAFCAGRQSPLPELPIQYADYAAWQRERSQDKTTAEHLSYWRARLAGAPKLLELPLDYPRPAVRSLRSGAHHFHVGADLKESLSAVGRREGATLFMTLLAGWYALLARYTGQTDIVVGTEVPNRERAETESLVGCFASQLPLRADLGGDPSFGELLGRVKETYAEAFAHREVPFEGLAEELWPGGNVGYAPLLQAGFEFQRPLEASEAGGLSFLPAEVSRGACAYDLCLSLTDTEGGLSARLEYNAGLFEAATVGHFTGHFLALLRSVAAGPRKRLGESSLSSEEERRKLLAGWRGGERQLARRCLHELFEEQAARTPASAAVSSVGERLTYDELNRRANRLARYLKSHGVGGEATVAILLERTAEMVVVLFGVLKAGGAFVLFDTESPGERHALMLGEARPRLVLTRRQFLNLLPGETANALCLEDAWAEAASEDESNLTGGGAPDALAYVTFKPEAAGGLRGVLVTHANVVSLLESARLSYNSNEADVWTLFSSCALNCTVWEMWGALLYGGRLVVVPPRDDSSLEEFYTLLSRERVAAFRHSLEARRHDEDDDASETAGPVSCVVIFGGETLDLSGHCSWYPRAADAPERFAHVSYSAQPNGHRPRRGSPSREASGAVGSVLDRVYADLQVYVLDARGRLAPVGIAGDLYVGGGGVARGLLGRPRQTALSFLPNPFGPEPGARLYRTGACGRYRTDGRVEYLGRRDRGRVPLRGAYVNVSAVEEVLLEHELVRAAVVAPGGSEPCEQHLVACLVCDGTRPAAAELRSFMEERLPPHLIPSAFVFVKQLPRTPDGRIDRRAAPVSDSSRTSAGTPHEVEGVGQVAGGDGHAQEQRSEGQV